MTNNHARRYRRNLLSSATAFTLVLAAEPAQAAQPTTGPQTSVNTDQIVITGTRRTDRTVTNSASPVDVISQQELKTQPTANLLDSIKNIVPSFWVPQNTISDASTFVRSPSLRGLPGDETLVQINGKRMNRAALVQVYTGGDTGLSFGSQGADISAIPSIALKNLQILRDGATAQYGSDAIAGVMNFQLRTDRRGLELQGRYGQYFDHGHTKLDSGKSRQVAGNLGVGIGATGFIDVAGEYNSDDGTSRGHQNPIATIFAQQNPSLAAQLPNYPLPAQIWGSSPQHGWKAMLNSGVDVTPNSQLYLTLLGAYSKSNASFNYRPPIAGTAVDESGVVRNITGAPNSQAFGSATGVGKYFYLPCPTGNATCPAGGYVQDNSTAFVFTSIYPAGFTPRFIGVTKERFGTVGYKGSLDGGLTWDLSGTYGRNTLTLSMNQSASPSYGPASQTSFQFGTMSQKEYNLNADFTYPLNLGLFSPVTLAWGAEYRKETYGQTTGDVQSYGGGPYAIPHPLYTQTSPGVYALVGTSTNCSAPGAVCTAVKAPGASGYGGTSPEAAGSWGQWSWGFYGDLEADVTDKLSMGLAGRFEHYNTFGDSFVYKLNAIYKVIPQLSIRGTIGTGFHAPSPGQAHDSLLTTNFNSGVQTQTGTYPVDSPISRHFGSTTLGPEKSRNYGAGIVLKPTPAVTVTADGYIINVRDRIGISQTFNVSAADVAAEPALAAVGVGGAVTYFTNGFDTSTKGVDVVGTWRTHAFDGNMTWTLAYNYNHSKVTRFDAGVISLGQRINVEHLAPNHRATLSMNWNRGPFSLNARENYYGWWANAIDYCTGSSVTPASCNSPTGYQHFGAKWTTDVDVSYTFMDHVTLTLGANNLFNTYPDKIAQSSINPVYVMSGSIYTGAVYPRTGGPFGMNGGMWYVRLDVKLGNEARYVPPPPVVAPPPPPPVVEAPPPAAPPPPPPPPPPPTEKGERGQ